jgi:hypothetical protein
MELPGTIPTGLGTLATTSQAEELQKTAWKSMVEKHLSFPFGMIDPVLSCRVMSARLQKNKQMIILPFSKPVACKNVALTKNKKNKNF